MRVERDGDRNDLWMEKALSPAPARGGQASWSADPATNPPPASPDPEDATPTGADRPSEAPAPFKGVDEDVKPVEERLKDVERDRQAFA